MKIMLPLPYSVHGLSQDRFKFLRILRSKIKRILRLEGRQRRNRANLSDDQTRIWRALAAHARNSKGPRARGWIQ